MRLPLLMNSEMDFICKMQCVLHLTKAFLITLPGTIIQNRYSIQVEFILFGNDGMQVNITTDG